jgi:hypothetical protein
MSKYTLPLFLAFAIISNAHAYGFKPRPEIDCGELNPEMSEWFQESLNQPKKNLTEAPIERLIGPVKKQKVGWCFAFSAADMISQLSGINISGAHVAKNYYTKSKMAWLLGSEEGGPIEHALEFSLNTPLCDEYGFSSKEITNLAIAKTRNCTRPATVMRNYKIDVEKAAGHFDGFTLFKAVDDILQDGRIAGISYEHSQLYRDKKDYSVKVIPDHASTIVARYFDKKQSTCRYIIRNTTGSDCTKIETNKTQCVGGYYSVTENKLNSLLVEVVSIKGKR